MQTLKTGSRIQMDSGECARIGRWTKVSGPRRDGWYIVRFDDGGALQVHETRFRVIDNR